MPTPSSSFDSIASLPPRVVAIRNAIFQTPDDTGLSVSVPTTYALYTGSIAPASDVGENGDWYFYAASGTLRTYRKVIGVWALVSTITGGSGGGAITELDGVAITGSSYSGGTISGSAISGGTISGAIISGSTLVSPAITDAAFTGATLVSPVVTNGTFTGPIVSGPVITGGTITSAVITGLTSPVNASDAATKQYVDGLAAGLDIHASCRVGTTLANIALSGSAPDELDGISLALNDRVLVKDQTNQIENGIYVVSTLGTGANGTWTRATDADSGNELDSAYVLVEIGTSNGGSSWVVSGTPLIGTDNVVWTRFFAVTSIPASIITGTLEYGQIGSVNASAIIGTINSTQIGSVNAGTIAGTISSTQIDSVNASSIIGSITSAQIGSVNASAIAGSISASQIGSVHAAVIAGTINSTQISSVSATSISGSITSTQIGSVSAGTITGVIVTNQLADQILNTQRLIASDLSIIRRLASLPTLPSAEYPVSSLVLNTTNKTLYQNVAGVWTVVTASSNVVGTLTANDIASVNAASITGLIIATQISSVNATSITGSITSAQIGSVAASSITGSITSAQIGSVNASALTGSISADRITAVNASSLLGSISADRITSVNASAITGSISSAQIGSVNATAITGSISSAQIGSVNATTINVGSLESIAYGIGSGGSRTSITSGGFDFGSGRIIMSVDSSNPRIRLNGIGTYAAGSIVLNCSSTSIPPFIQVSDGTKNVAITGAALALSAGAAIIVNTGCVATIASGGTLRGPGGINLFGGDANALSIACGEDATADSLYGYLVLQVNGRAVKVPFHGL